MGEPEVSGALRVVIVVQPWPHRPECMTTARARVASVVHRGRSSASLFMIFSVTSPRCAGLGARA